MSALLNTLHEARYNAKHAVERAEREWRAANLFPRGLVVRVVKGRKLPVGSSFVVAAAGEGRFGYFVKNDDGVFIDRGNVEIIDPAFERIEAAHSKAIADLESIESEIKAERDRIIRAAGIDLRVRENVEHKSYGWREDDEYDTVCDPLASDETVAAAVKLADPDSSHLCISALRWSCGTRLVARLAPDRIRVYSSTGIAD